MTQAHNASADPRCPYCGRPVLGAFVQGGEGRYHPACVQPPQDAAPWPAPIYVPWPPWPIGPQWVCNRTAITASGE